MGQLDLYAWAIKFVKDIQILRNKVCATLPCNTITTPAIVIGGNRLTMQKSYINQGAEKSGSYNDDELKTAGALPPRAHSTFISESIVYEPGAAGVGSNSQKFLRKIVLPVSLIVLLIWAFQAFANNKH